MVSAAGFGVEIEGLVGDVANVILNLLTFAYKEASGFVSWFVGTFPFDNKNKVFALSVITFCSIVLLMGFLGGTGIHGQISGGEGYFGLNAGGVNIGTSNAVIGVSQGLNTSGASGAGELTTSTLGNQTTTTIASNETILTCGGSGDCISRYSEGGSNFCCPAGSGGCAGLCINDYCQPACQTYCVYDDSNPQKCLYELCVEGTENYGNCIQKCIENQCIKNTQTVYLIAPSNNSYVTNGEVTFKWT